MAWQWSHTPEAYAAARENVAQLSRTQLLTILREWAYHDREQANTLRFPDNKQVWTDSKGKAHIRGFRLPNGLKRLPTDILTDAVWERMEALQSCDNGGFNAYCCPDGCHTVSFDYNDKE